MEDPKAAFCVVQNLDFNEADVSASKNRHGRFCNAIVCFCSIETMYHETKMHRIKAIKRAITKKDIDKLRQLAIEHGFINDKLRKRAWPLVLGIQTVPKERKQSLHLPMSPLKLKHATPFKPKNHESELAKGYITQPNTPIMSKPPKLQIPNFDFDEWLTQNDLMQIKQIFIDHDMNTLEKLSFYKANFGVFMIDKRLTVDPMLLQRIVIAMHELRKNPIIYSPKIAESKTAEIASPNSISADYEQIERDIARSSINYYVKEKEQKESAEHLGNILHSMFDENNDWHYIQGFNDVTSVIYAVCRNEQLAQKITQKVAETLFCDYILVQNDNDYLDVGLYKLIFDIIQCEDKELDKVLDNGHDFISISISWLLTWFAHHIKSKERICRIYDYCLSSDKMISSYLSAALIINCKDELLYAVQEEGISIFEFFNDLDWEKQDFDKLISLAERLHKQYSSYLNFKKYASKHSKTVSVPSPDDEPIPVTPELSMDFEDCPFAELRYENHEEFAGISHRSESGKNIHFRKKDDAKKDEERE